MIHQGLIETTFHGDGEAVCSGQDPFCGRVLTPGMECFVDVETEGVWCLDCGKCERYHRSRSSDSTLE